MDTTGAGASAGRRGWLAASTLLAAPPAAAQLRGPPRDLALAEPAFPIPPGFPQPITARGNALHGADGARAVRHGACIADVAWIAGRNDRQLGFFDHRLFSMASAWGCDMLRLSVMPAIWRRLGEAHALSAIDASIAYARRCGMYVSICWHGIGFPPEDRYMPLRDMSHGLLFDTTTPEMRRFWTRIAQRYGQNPVVCWFELFNEPQAFQPDGRPVLQHTDAHWLAWRDWAEAMVDTIRQHAPAKTVVVGGLQFSYDLSFARRMPVRRDNIAYATHPYPNSNWRVPWQRAFLEPAAALPVIVSEFGWDHRDHPERAMRGGSRPYRQEIMEAMDRAGLGWTAWCFSHAFTPALLANADFQPSPDFGDAIRAELLRRRQPPRV